MKLGPGRALQLPRSRGRELEALLASLTNETAAALEKHSDAGPQPAVLLTRSAQ